ncbi:RNA polymerase sigma factor, sigma-70 family protein [Bacteroides fragilis str. 3996 N(B) 6]|nr:RNA polymerase sigma factor, sigma-70 family protein [Bacteroides fragilis str. 3996 N(B) 6]
MDAYTNLTAYLFTSIKNRCLDYLRKWVLEQETAQGVQDEFEMELRMKYDSLEIFNTQFSDETDIGELLDNALQKLPERCRNIFIMNKLEGKKQKEIAEELNLSINTVESQMGIAYKKLREELKDCLPLFIFLFAIS